MNKKKDLRCFWLTVLFCIVGKYTYAQDQSITSYIRLIESNSAYIFNYDVSQTDTFKTAYPFSNVYSLAEIIAFFHTTPFEISIKGERIVLLPVRKYNYRICGRILSDDREALAFANIRVGGSQGTTSDEAGRFSLEVSCYKNELCHIRYLGYESKTYRLEELTDCPDVMLRPSDFLLARNIIVTAYLKSGITEGRSYGGLNLGFNQLKNELAIHNQDIFQTLQQLPGISSPDDSAVNLNIRGGTPDHNLISWEGVTLYDQGFLFGTISSINPYSIEKVSIFKSNHNPALDNKIGGVVNMYLPETIPNQLTSTLGFNLTDAYGYIHLPIVKDKLSILVSGRKSLQNLWEDNPTYASYTKKIFQSERITEDGETNEVNENDHVKINFHDFNAKLIVQPTDRLKLQSSLLTTSNDNANISSFNSINLATSDNYSSSSTALSSRIAYRLFRNDSVGIGHSYSKFEQESESEFSKIDTTLNILKREESNQIIDHQVRLSYSFGKDKSRSTLGYVFDKKATQLEYEEYSIAQSETETYIDASNTFHHLFANHQFVKNRTFLELGARASYSSKLSKSYFSPSFSFRYKAMEYLRLKTSGGIYHQFIRQVYEPIDNNFNLENAIWTLDVEKGSPILNARKVAGGFILNVDDWLIDVETYYHRTKGLAAQNPNIRNTIVVDADNELISKGIDFLIHKRIHRFKNSIYYSISRNDVFLPIQEEDEETEIKRFDANNHQLHNLKLLTAYKIKNMELSLSYHYKSGLPYTDNVSIMEDEEEEDEYELQYEKFNNKELRDYHRVDASLLYSNQWKDKNYEIGLTVLNLLNHKNLGTRKSILSETNDQNNTPEILELNKTLLPITFNLHARLYW